MPLFNFDIIDMHIKSAKHTRGKLKLLQQKKTEVTETLKPYDSVNHAVGESLPDSTRVFRVKVVQYFLQMNSSTKKVCTTFTRKTRVESGSDSPTA